MGQPCSDTNLILQHSNKMPNSDDLGALKMEFIECNVSQFSTSSPTLTRFQPNSLFHRTKKPWDELPQGSTAQRQRTPEPTPVRPVCQDGHDHHFTSRPNC